MATLKRWNGSAWVAVSGTTDTIDEDFESYTVPNSIIGGTWSWIVGPAGTDSMTCQTGKIGRFTHGGTGRTQVAHTFSTASDSSPAAGWWVQNKLTIVNTGSSKGMVFMTKSAASPLSWVELHHDGKIYGLNNTTLTDTGYTWSVSTEYYLKIEGASATTFNAYWGTDSSSLTKIINGYTFYGGASTSGQQVTKFAMDTNFFGSTNSDGQCDVDDITGSWTSGTVNKFKCYTGGSFTAKTLKRYNGSTWETVT